MDRPKNQPSHNVDEPRTSRLRFSVRYQGGYEVYSWTALPSRNVLLPGESLPFSSRLASPPREGDRVEVRFFNRRDLSAELPRGGAL